MVNGTAIKIPHIKPEKDLWRNPLFSVMITALAQALSPWGIPSQYPVLRGIS
jgi:hypothetical protein